MRPLRTQSTPVIVIVALSVLVFSMPSAAVAAVYRYIDEQGAAAYTDSLDKVPEQYRDRAEEISRDDLRYTEAPIYISEKQIEAEGKPLGKAKRYLSNAVRGNEVYLGIAGVLIALALVVAFLRTVEQKLQKVVVTVLLLLSLGILAYVFI